MADMAEVKTLIEAQGRAWEEFKRVNDERIARVEKGLADGDQKAALAKMNSDLDSLGKTLAEVQLAAQRPALGEKGNKLNADQLAHKQAFLAYMRKGETAGLADVQRKAMNSTSDPDGGYLVDETMEATIDRVVSVMSAMPRIARTVTIGTRSWQKRVKKTGMSAAWPGEGTGAGETTEPTFANIEVVAFPIEVEPWVHNETLEDADIDLAADLADEASIAFAEGEGTAFITGAGVGKPFGLTSYNTVANASYAWGSIGYIASGKSGAFASVAPADKIVDLVHSLKSQYRPGATFLMSDATLGTARQMKDGSGSYYLWQPDPLAGFGGRLLGHPVEIDDNMPAVAANSLSIAFGNFQRGYAIVRRTGIGLIRDNVTTKGQTKFNFRRRVGGGVYNFEAIKVMKFAAS